MSSLNQTGCPGPVMGVSCQSCLCLQITSRLICYGPGGSVGAHGTPQAGRAGCSGQSEQGPLGSLSCWLSQPCARASPAGRPQCRGCLATPPSPVQPSPDTQVGTVQRAGKDNRVPFVTGVWGCHWHPGVGGEGMETGPGSRLCAGPGWGMF